MVSGHLGCYDGTTPGGNKYVSHNGAWGLGYGWDGISAEGTSLSSWMRFDNGIIAVLMVNYNYEPVPDVVLRNAFDKAAE